MYYVLLARYLHYNIMLDKLNVKNRRIHQITVGLTLINQMSVGYTLFIITLPYASLDIFKNSFAYRGPFIWNDLPHDIRKCATLSCFKTALKAHILNV